MKSSEHPDYIPPVKCVICKKELKPICEGTKETGFRVMNGYDMIDGGVAGCLYAPFGSENDGSIYQIGICDHCIKKVKLVEIGNYLFSDIDATIKKQSRKKQ